MLFLVLGIAPACNREAREPKEQPADVRQTAPAPPAERATAEPSTSEVGSGGPVAPSPTPAVVIEAGKQQILFHVQVAATPEERANGLVGRPTLASDAGLLLVFDEPAVQTVDMENTLIATDLLFIGPDRRIVGIVQNAKPRMRAKRRVEAPAQYVLQIAAGSSARHRFRVGQTVELRSINGS